jgi:ferric-dicitrate binding protein FerR (iron transport regulator)
MPEKESNDPAYYQELIHKLITGAITPAEKQLLEQWYNENQDNPVEIPASFAASETEHEKRLLQKIMQKAAMDTPVAPLHRTRVVTAYRWWAVAAAVLLLISAGIYFASNRGSNTGLATTQTNSPALDITPVTKNVLTLPGLSKIWLDEVNNGPIAKLGHTTITKQDNRITYTSTDPDDAAGYQVISTAPGSAYEVVLTDGSRIWLNAASSIRFPTAFSGPERMVDLCGQAWFDVQHADKVPFLVHSRSLTTTVLGTAFDIKDYSGEKDRTVSVQRGKVKVQTGGKVLATLEKGQQVKLSPGNIVHQQPIDTLAIAAWKQGNLVYTDETLEAIVADLQRVFNNPIIIKNAALKDVKTAGVFNKRTGLQQTLEIICNITDSHLSKKNGVFIIE